MLTLEGDLFGEDGLHDFRFAGAVEGRSFEEHHEEDYAGGPDVALLIVLLAKHLGSDVVGSAYPRVEYLAGLLLLNCDSEVDELDRAGLLFEEDVLRLDVPVHDVLGVDVGQRFQDLLGDLACLRNRYLALGDALEEFAALAQLHYEHIVVLVVVDLVELGDVGVVQRLQDLDLVEEALVLLRVHVRLLDLLGRADDARVLPAHLVDAAEPAAAQLAPHLVVVQETALLHLQETHPTHPNLLDLGPGLAACRAHLLLLRLGLVDVEVGQRLQVEEVGLAGRFGGRGGGDGQGDEVPVLLVEGGQGGWL
jgi:hypothetical protein